MMSTTGARAADAFVLAVLRVRPCHATLPCMQIPLRSQPGPLKGPGPDDRVPPLTPPRVAGVSLAPVPDSELMDAAGTGGLGSGAAAAANGAAAAPAPTAAGSQQPHGQPNRPPVPAGVRRPTMMARAGPTTGPTIAKSESFKGSSSGTAQPEGPQLMAEGRGIPRGGPVVVLGPAGPGSGGGHFSLPPLEVDPRVAMFNEINEVDSLW